MRDINKLSDNAKIEKAWKENNSIKNSINTEQKRREDVSKHIIKILDAKYSKLISDK